jgi:hypothetical protein
LRREQRNRRINKYYGFLFTDCLLQTTSVVKLAQKVPKSKKKYILLKYKKARNTGFRALCKTNIDYGKLCGVPVKVLNEQLTCGVAPTVVVL